MKTDNKTNNKNKKCIHDGHRKRLLNTVNEVGLEPLSRYQAMEFFLFYIFPRGDVNPLSHKLLDRFEGVSSVIDASVEDLMEVEGLGETTAKKIHAMSEMFFYYAMDKINQSRIKDMADFYDYLETFLRLRTEENVFLFGVDSSGAITRGRRFAKGDSNMVGVNMTDVLLYISTYKVSRLILVHNHPDGSCEPSELDRNSFKGLKESIEHANAKLIDCIIVGRDGIFSMEKNEFRRLFNGELKYRQAIDLAMMKQDSNKI